MWFFDSGAALVAVVVRGVVAYVALVAVLRVSGKRTLSKMNAFDLSVIRQEALPAGATPITLGVKP